MMPLEFYQSYPLGNNKRWITRFHLDSMTYYKMLFPPDKYYDAVTRIEGVLLPQVSVNLIDNGAPQEIYLMYVNGSLVYYNGVTESMKYVFQVYPGMVKIDIRTLDKLISVDSLYIQPNCLTFISVSICIICLEIVR